MRDRYYFRTIGYHVWGIFKRHDDNLADDTRPNSDLDTMIESVGARGRGDAGARRYCRESVSLLNDRAGIPLDDELSQE